MSNCLLMPPTFQIQFNWQINHTSFHSYLNLIKYLPSLLGPEWITHFPPWSTMSFACTSELWQLLPQFNHIGWSHHNCQHWLHNGNQLQHLQLWTQYLYHHPKCHIAWHFQWLNHCQNQLWQLDIYQHPRPTNNNVNSCNPCSWPCCPSAFSTTANYQTSQSPKP